MNEAGGGERGSRCSGSSQTPCKESCHAAGMDTLPRPPRGRSPRQSTRGTPSCPGFGQGPPDPGPAVPRLGGHVAVSQHLPERSAPRRVPASPSLVPLSWLRRAHSSQLRQAGADPVQPLPGSFGRNQALTPSAAGSGFRGREIPFCHPKASVPRGTGSPGNTHQCPYQSISRHPVALSLSRWRRLKSALSW